MATPQKKGNDFTWFDKKAGITKNEAGEDVYVPGGKGALSIIGTTMQAVAAPFAGDTGFAQRQNAIDAQRQQNDSSMFEKLLKDAQAKNDPVVNYNKLDATLKTTALHKLMQGIPLNDAEKLASGWKDSSTVDKPSLEKIGDWARDYAKTVAGGSSQTSIIPEKRAEFDFAREASFFQQAQSWGVEDQQTRRRSANFYLKNIARVPATEENIKTFLEKNKDINFWESVDLNKSFGDLYGGGNGRR